MSIYGGTTVSHKGGPVGLVRVPDEQGHAPLTSWKRIGFVQDVLPPSDAGRVVPECGLIIGEGYSVKLPRGES